MMRNVDDNFDRRAQTRVRDHRGCRRGFTLIELLAVAVILAMVAAIAVVNIGALSASAQRRAVAQQWQELDARARLHARSEGSVRLHVESDNHAIRLIRTATNEPLAFIELPPGTTARLQIDRAEPTTHITVDRAGRSADYTASVELDGNRSVWIVSGLTGWIQQQETTPW